MSKFSSLITVLKVNEPKPVTTKSGRDILIHSAEAMLLDEKGDVTKVGQLPVPESLVSVVTPGTFSAVFALTVSEYGQDQGRIVARLTGLTPVPAGALRPLAPAAPPKL